MAQATAVDYLFGGAENSSAAQKSADFDEYNKALNATYAETDRGDVSFGGMTGEIGSRVLQKGWKANPGKMVERFDRISGEIDTLNKALGGGEGDAANANALALMSEIANMRADIQKDWTPSNPVGGTGLVAYDLEAPAKRLVPLYTPLRNSIPRNKGVGNARKFKRIDSFSNSGQASPNLSVFFNSLTQTSAWGPTGNVTLARPQKISYTGSDFSLPYVELGLSDSVDWVAQFQGLGFDDLRGLSHTALLYAHMMGEERAMLYGRGTQTGYSGVVAAPSSISLTTATTGGSIAASTTNNVFVTTYTGNGESATVTTSALTTTGSTSTISVTLGSQPAGALAYGVYVGQSGTPGAAHFQGYFIPNTSGVLVPAWNGVGAQPTVTLTSLNTTSPAPGASDSSASASAYDGLLTVQSNPAISGYVQNLNAALSRTSPGSEFDAAFATMYQNNGADPDEIWVTGSIRNEINQVMRVGSTNGAQSGYRTNLNTGDGSVTMGTSVSGVVNGNTGKVVDVKTHRFMPIGCALIRSTSLPIEDSHIPAPVAAVNVQDYMAVDWPVIQMTYDASTYQIGSLIHYAPLWSGVILGIQ